MIQRHTILINLNYSANTLDTAVVNDSALQTTNDYLVNNVQGLGGGIVNPSNVRGFLNDSVNSDIINDFFVYLQGATTPEGFSEIFYSDQKLSNVFNSYYESSVVNNELPSSSVISQSLSGTFKTTVVKNEVLNFDGTSPLKGLDNIPLSINNSTRKSKSTLALDTFTDEDSYYIPVFITRTSKQMAALTFKPCDDVVSLLLNSEPSNQGLGLGVDGDASFSTTGLATGFATGAGAVISNGTGTGAVISNGTTAVLSTGAGAEDGEGATFLTSAVDEDNNLVVGNFLIIAS